MRLPIDPAGVKGYLDPEEGEALYRWASDAAAWGPCLEVGSYCGKSALYRARRCASAAAFFSRSIIHRGSEEMQPGWEHHDPETWDARAGTMETLPFLRDTLHRAKLEDHVIPIIGARPSSHATGTRLCRCSSSTATLDRECARRLSRLDGACAPGGFLAIHDVFPNPEDGGRPPYEIYRFALASRMFRELEAVKSLRLLVRLSA